MSDLMREIASFGEEASIKSLQSLPTSSASFRYFLPYGGQGYAILLEDATGEVSYNEHVVKIGNNYHEIACLQGRPEGCPLCDAGDRPSWTAFITVMEVTHVPQEDGSMKVIKEIKRQSGDLLVNPIKLLPMKKGNFEWLLRQREKREGVNGCVYEVRRSSKDANKTASRIGDSWEFEAKISPENLLKYSPEAKPLNLEEELKGSFKQRDQIITMMQSGSMGLTANANTNSNHAVPTPPVDSNKGVVWA